MAKIISVYSATHNQGKKTCALALAKILAENNANVLFAELDYTRPSTALATLITHDLRNMNEYVQQTVRKKMYDFAPYVLTKKELEITARDRERKKLYSELPEHLSYLIFPFGFEERNFPTILEEDAEPFAEAYIEKMMYAFKTSSYPYIILILPAELDSIFGFEVLNHSDYIVNVVTPNAARLFEDKKAKSVLFTNLPHVKEKWIDVVNMTSPRVSDAVYRKFVDEQAIRIEFDMERQSEELDLQFASPAIIEKMEQVAMKIGVELTAILPKKRPFFKKRLRDEK